MYRPILIKNISLFFSNKTCFENFSAKIYSGDRIAIIGRNGSGKSSLLNILNGNITPSDGEVIMPNSFNIGHIEQTITNFNTLSGGQRLNKRLSEALNSSSDLLLLDEPTNHLDRCNRKNLLKNLSKYGRTLVVVSHDIELLRNNFDKFWHISDGKIYEFCGEYDDYIKHINQKRLSIEKELLNLKSQKKSIHNEVMKEQQRAAKSKAKGQKSINQRKWPTVVSKAKASRAEKTSGKKKSYIDKRKNDLYEKLSNLRLPKVIVPKFSLSTSMLNSNTLVSISDGSIGYNNKIDILRDINFTLMGKEKIVICGDNATGKSTLLKAILSDKNILKTGTWNVPNCKDIGYLDQHYSNLEPEKSAFEHINSIREDWSETESRRHLNAFLFSNNKEAMQPIKNFSGGEKARLSLSIIAAKVPKLLVLDEVTNNLDLETKEHVSQILKEYPGAMIVVSHDERFINSIGIEKYYKIKNGGMVESYKIN